ncbi:MULTISPECIES: (d)CMP kinase [Carboxydocella]|uniref:Cytidylate kinase n=2 Tax=Carboxydocella TaxID=178898 RepID=A0A1T4RT97_9FIRM|nr:MULTISPECIES: (d)CMP kinase [Carboxydocella]AVX20403.1 cytidylate kinase [Carboxydocella thermautotrophica]AVX30826.1 cytidylate kinase [Carboxydocella thermautotrophica]SKA19214.1 cytidylate kinase [Carboxydocella sporoproducens DSM 16521]
MSKLQQIAIDGPAGAGKSTIARLLARQLGYLYVDTGAMYRAVTLKVLKQGLDPGDEKEIADMLTETEVDLIPATEGLRVILDGEDVSDAIRTPQVSQAVSQVARIPAVREKLTIWQRALGEKWPVVMDGRDIGTVVLPEAEHKFFLTASLEERARRRYLELKSKGYTQSFESLLEEMALRDKMDSGREIAPLKPAEDAQIIDTTGMTIEEVVNELLKRLGGNT